MSGRLMMNFDVPLAGDAVWLVNRNVDQIKTMHAPRAIPRSTA